MLHYLFCYHMFIQITVYVYIYVRTWPVPVHTYCTCVVYVSILDASTVPLTTPYAKRGEEGKWNYPNEGSTKQAVDKSYTRIYAYRGISTRIARYPVRTRSHEIGKIRGGKIYCLPRQPQPYTLYPLSPSPLALNSLGSENRDAFKVTLYHLVRASCLT